MKTLPTTYVLIATVFLLFLTGCASSHLNEPGNFQQASDPYYGYSPNKPIPMKAAMRESKDKAIQFLSGLKTKMGNRFEIIAHSTIPNPCYKKPRIILWNFYTGEQINPENGPVLDVFTLKPENEKDTIPIFINRFIESEIMIPANLDHEMMGEKISPKTLL